MDTYTNYRRPEAQEAHNGHTIAELLRELREETVTLAKQEVALAKAEMKEKASLLSRNAIYMAVGALIAYGGAIFLCIAGMRLITLGLVNAGVDPDIAAWLSPAILGLAIVLIGTALIMKAKSAFSKESLMPKKTIQSIKEDTSWTRAKLKEA